MMDSNNEIIIGIISDITNLSTETVTSIIQLFTSFFGDYSEYILLSLIVIKITFTMLSLILPEPIDPLLVSKKDGWFTRARSHHLYKKFVWCVNKIAIKTKWKTIPDTDKSKLGALLTFSWFLQSKLKTLKKEEGEIPVKTNISQEVFDDLVRVVKDKDHLQYFKNKYKIDEKDTDLNLK